MSSKLRQRRKLTPKGMDLEIQTVTSACKRLIKAFNTLNSKICEATIADEVDQENLSSLVADLEKNGIELGAYVKRLHIVCETLEKEGTLTPSLNSLLKLCNTMTHIPRESKPALAPIFEPESDRVPGSAEPSTSSARSPAKEDSKDSHRDSAIKVVKEEPQSERHGDMAGGGLEYDSDSDYDDDEDIHRDLSHPGEYRDRVGHVHDNTRPSSRGLYSGDFNGEARTRSRPIHTQERTEYSGSTTTRSEPRRRDHSDRQHQRPVERTGYYDFNYPSVHERSMKLMYLSTLTPVKFNGQPRDFPSFDNRIRMNLEDGVLHEQEQLEMLPKFITGEPLELVNLLSGCSYNHVMSVITERFGHPQMVANDYINQLTEGPSIKGNDRKGLRQYSDTLNAAVQILRGEYFRAASVTPYMTRMADRLPHHAQVTWEKKANRIGRDKPGGPDIADLARYVRKMASDKNNPYYQASASRGKDTSSSTRSGNTSRIQSMPTTYTEEYDVDSDDSYEPTHAVTLKPSYSTPQPKFDKQHPAARRDGKSTSATGQNWKKSTYTSAEPARSTRSAENGSTGKQQYFNNSSDHSKLCKVCDKGHDIVDCQKFRSMDMPTRVKLVRVYKLCYICLQSNCKWDACPKSNDERTVCLKCDRRHHKDLIRCFTSISKPKPKPEESVQAQACDTASSSFMLMTLPVVIHGKNGKSVSTYAFLDTGSRASFIDQSLAKELEISGPAVSKKIRTVMTEHSQQLLKVEFDISGVGSHASTRTCVDSDAYIIPNINLSDHIGSRLLPHEVDVSKHEHLRSLSSISVDRRKVNLLIGLPIQEAHQVIAYHRGKVDEPYGIETKLGIALAGPVGTTSATLPCNFTLFQDVVAEPSLEELVERLWKLEDERRRADDHLSPMDQRAVQIFNDTVHQTESGHYECGMLWKDADCTLPLNRNAAVRRLLIVKQKFAKEGPDYESMYRSAMREYTDNGWAEKIPVYDVNKSGPRTFYLPHFGIVNENKPGKIRCVFDAAAKVEGISLNSALIPGPDSTSSLVGVLLRSRLAKYCIAGDVRSMFNQCLVTRKDVDSLRYVWFDENDKIADYRMLTHTFGKADSPFAANRIMKQIALDHGSEYSEDIVDAVTSRFYVDDTLLTSGTVEGSITLAKGVKSLLSKGGFELTKFNANDKRILQAFDKCDLADPGSVDLDLDPLTSTRALGLQWHLDSDAFGYKVQKTDFPLTLRGVTSAVARVFDPLGFASAFVLPARRVIQDSWKEKLDWDQPLVPDLAKTFVAWLDTLPNLGKLKIPRRLFPDIDDCRLNVKDMQLHMFSDASEYATGVAAFLRAIDSDDVIHCSRLVVGKSKLLPLSPKLTIPRAELKAAVESARIAEKLKLELPFHINSSYYWTDSKIVLGYIQNETKNFSTYVANRQSECRRLAPPDRWRHIPGPINVSDDASRGLQMNNISNSHRYFTGPDFLCQPESEWPGIPSDISVSSNDPELKSKSSIRSCHTATEDDSSCKNSVMQWVESRSSHDFVLKVIARCIRWTLLIRDKSDIPSLCDKTSTRIRDRSELPSLSIEAKKKSMMDRKSLIQHSLMPLAELENSELAIIRLVQSEFYSDEFSDLVENESVSRSSSLIALAPFVDSDGTLRVGGRIRNADLPYTTRHPVILPDPKKCQFSAMIVYSYHLRLAHGGRDLIMGSLLEKYHIVNVRNFIRNMIRSCIPCRRRNARASSQLMADLPIERLTAFEPCFTYCGTDCFGPIVCKVHRRKSPYYGVLFLCMNSKAIHLEMVKTLGTDDFLLALMRFVSLRGNVKQIRSDNGSNYVGAERNLREIVKKWNEKQIHDELRAKNVHWEWQKPYASAQSGIWERRVKETKRHLYAILAGATPSPDVLRTVFCEVACIMNQVPLTPVSDSIDSYDVLTPAHFLFQRPATLVAPVGDEAEFSHSRQKWRNVCMLSTAYWNRWLKEYVPSLQKRVKWTAPRRNLSVGDLVTVMEDFLPRSKWIFGRVIETFPDSKGRVRSAKIRTPTTEYVRPIQKLAVVCEVENL